MGKNKTKSSAEKSSKSYEDAVYDWLLIHSAVVSMRKIIEEQMKKALLEEQ